MIQKVNQFQHLLKMYQRFCIQDKKSQNFCLDDKMINRIFAKCKSFQFVFCTLDKKSQRKPRKKEKIKLNVFAFYKIL